jgi:cytoskeleton protein RodZ
VSEDAARDTEAGPGLGGMLRRAREARGLTEQQAAEQLTLDVTVVSALERDDLAALGAPVFAKGHLRRYGAMLGIGEDELLAAYERARAQPETPTLIPRSRQEMMPVRGRPKWPWVIGGTLLFVLAAGLAAYVSEYGLPWPSAAPGDSVSTADPAVIPAPSPDALAGSGAVAIEPPAAEPGGVVDTASADASPLPVPPGHVSLSIRFAADSWTEIYDGSGKAVLYDLGRAGTQRAIAAAAPLSVTFGNAPAVTLLVNGQPAALPAVPAGQTVARFRVEADGTLR